MGIFQNKNVFQNGIQVFRNENSSQTNVYLHYSNYSYSRLIPNERALNIFKENAFYGLQKILLGNFPRNLYIWSAIVNGTCMQKIKIGHQAKFWAKNKCFSTDFISYLCNFTQHLTSSVLIVIQSADTCPLVIVR